jgi:hypothetical protein
MTVAVRVPATPMAGSEAKEVGTHPIEEAAKVAAKQPADIGGLGRPGRPIDRRSPFFIGMAGAAGVAITIALLELVIRARSVLELIGLALFIAAGLDPVVSWLTRRRVPRWAAVVIVLLALAGTIGMFIAAAIPPLAAQTSNLIAELPRFHQQHDRRQGDAETGQDDVKPQLGRHLRPVRDDIPGHLRRGQQHRCASAHGV